MGREIKRVSLDFDFPIDASYSDHVWGQHKPTCESCQQEEENEDGPSCTFSGSSPPVGEGWQLWQTVSDGPISPVFATADELIDWMSQPLSFEQQSRTDPGPYPANPWGQGWRKSTAEQFVKDQAWMPSGAMVGGRMLTTDEIVDSLRVR